MYKLLSIVALVSASTAASAATTNVNIAPKETKAAPTQKYCLKMDPATGSHIARMECRTKAEWKEWDVDMDALLAKNEANRKR